METSRFQVEALTVALGLVGNSGIQEASAFGDMEEFTLG